MKRIEPRPLHTLAILRRRQVEKKLGIGRSTIYDKMNPNSPRHDADFPRPIRLGLGAVGWVEHEVEEYLHLLIQRSRGEVA